MKKLTVILLFLIVVISQCGYYCFYAYKIYCAKKLAKQEILKQIPEGLLTKISIDDNKSIRWEDDGAEFLLNGEMYDVVKTEIENGKEFVYCISDKREDALFKDIANIIKRNTHSGSAGNHHNSLKFQINDIICTINNNLFQESVFVYTTLGFYDYKSKLSLTYKNVSTPPPQFF